MENTILLHNIRFLCGFERFSLGNFKMAKLLNLKLEEITIAEGVRKIVDEKSIGELSASFAKHAFYNLSSFSRVREATSCSLGLEGLWLLGKLA
jgi:hypothetical protein